MPIVRKRQAIAAADLANLAGLSPLSKASLISGIRVFDVGQGDAIAILADVGGSEATVLQIDYGGRERNPFGDGGDVDKRMPIVPAQLLMLTHWDEDHWCSASKGSLAQGADWLVPRQLTSPRAVLFSTRLRAIHCVPESLVNQSLRFAAQNGDCVLWEKIGYFAGAFAKDEDCNKTGLAFAIIRKGLQGEEVILLPGDAPFDKVGIFTRLMQRGVKLRGIVAFHHGAGTHWTAATEQLLQNWSKSEQFEVVFSCSRPNSYDHPDEARYRRLLPDATFLGTAQLRSGSKTSIEIRF